MKSNRFITKAIPELLIASIPAFFIIVNDLLNAMGIRDPGIETGILWGFPSQFFFMAIILLMSLIVSAVRDQEGWMKNRGPIHCIIIALAFPMIAEIWIHVSFNLLKRLPGKDLAMEAIVYFLIAVVLIPITLLLGIYVRFVLFSPYILGKQAFRERIVTASFLSFIFAYGLFVLAGGLEPRKTVDPNPDRISHLSFTHDGKAIVFARENGKSDTQIQTYDLHLGALALYVPPQGEMWTMPSCSPTGRKIVFVVRSPDKYKHPGTTQIATMNIDGSEHRKLTNSGGYKANPAISYSGRTILYSKDGNMKGPSKSDIYEVDVITKVEKRITNFDFLVTLFLQYFPDGKQFVFSGESPSALPETQGAESQLYKFRKKHLCYANRQSQTEAVTAESRSFRATNKCSGPFAGGQRGGHVFL